MSDLEFVINELSRTIDNIADVCNVEKDVAKGRVLNALNAIPIDEHRSMMNLLGMRAEHSDQDAEVLDTGDPRAVHRAVTLTVAALWSGTVPDPARAALLTALGHDDCVPRGEYQHLRNRLTGLRAAHDEMSNALDRAEYERVVQESRNRAERLEAGGRRADFAERRAEAAEAELEHLRTWGNDKSDVILRALDDIGLLDYELDDGPEEPAARIRLLAAERDRLRALADAMADEHGCVCETWREGMCSTCLYRAALDGEETPGWLSTSEERQATDGVVIRREEDDR